MPRATGKAGATAFCFHRPTTVCASDKSVWSPDLFGGKSSSRGNAARVSDVAGAPWLVPMVRRRPVAIAPTDGTLRGVLVHAPIGDGERLGRLHPDPL
jgi:hypothetical protein